LNNRNTVTDADCYCEQSPRIKNAFSTNTHTHNRFTALLEYVRDHPGGQVPERKNQQGLNQSGFTGARVSEWQ